MKRIASIMMIGLMAIAGCASRPIENTPTLPSLPKLASTAGDTEPAAQTVASSQPVTAQPATAQPTTAPSAPQLPAGHPDISKLMAEQAQQQRAQQQSQQDESSGMPQLPKGHPDISKLRAPATQPAAGTLTVRAVQGTAGAPAVGADPITVEVYGHDQLVGKLDIKLDEDGTTTVTNIPTGPGYQVFARVTHGGVEFDGAIDANSPSVQLSVPVFESTETRPDWNVQMRHLIVQPDDDGVHVTEILSINNPTDRAWLGEKSASSNAAGGKRTVFAIPLPPDATKVQLGGGFHDCCTKIDGAQITNTMPLVPGVTQYQYAYVLPVKNGAADIVTSFAAPVKSMMVLVPEGASASAVGLEGPRTVNMGNGNTQYFKATDLPAGKQVKLTVKAAAGATTTKASAAGGSAAGGSAAGGSADVAALVKAFGGVGVVLVVLFGAAFMFMKSPRQVRAAKVRA